MASVSNKKRVKPPKGRPASTSSISQPVVRDSSAVTALSSFSPDGARFAFLSLAVDKHRLRVYDTFSGRAAAEHVVEAARVTVLAWGLFNSSMAPPASADDEMDRPNKKKRRKQKSLDSDTENARPPAIEVVVLGLSDGSLSLFSPSHGRALRSLSHPSSTASVLCAVVGLNDDHDTTIWTSSADSVIRHWNATRNEILRSWKVGDPMPYTSMAIKPSSPVHGSGRTDILVANHAIRLLSTASDATQGTHVDNQKPYVLASFTGHASSIARLQWDVSQDPPTRFFSMAQADRFVYLWQLPTLRSSASAEGKIIASIPLDSDARTFSLRHSTAPPSSAAAKQSVLTLSMSGKICVFPIPAELQPPAGSKGVHHKVPTLLPRSTISISIKKSVSDVQIVDAMFCAEEGRVRLAKVVGGVKPTFEVAVGPSSHYYAGEYHERHARITLMPLGILLPT
jgi:U3 small nucleolar RNA-associated protein 5